MSKPTTVRELIAALEKLEPDLHVLIAGLDGGLSDAFPESDNDSTFAYSRDVVKIRGVGPHVAHTDGEHEGVIL